MGTRDRIKSEIKFPPVEMEIWLLEVKKKKKTEIALYFLLDKM